MFGEMRVALDRLVKRHLLKTRGHLMPFIVESSADTRRVAGEMLVQHGNDNQLVIVGFASMLGNLL